MAQIRVAILDQSTGTKTTVEIPNDVLMSQLIPALVESLQLPTHQGENLLNYVLYYIKSGKLTLLRQAETPEEAGIVNGAVLQLAVEIEGKSKGINNSGLSQRVYSEIFRDFINEENKATLSADNFTVAKETTLMDDSALLRLMFEMLEQRNLATENLERLIVELHQKVITLSSIVQKQDESIQILMPQTIGHDPNPLSEDELELELENLESQITYLDFDVVFKYIPDNDKMNTIEVTCAWSNGQQHFGGKHCFIMPLTTEELYFDYLLHMGLTKRSIKSPIGLAQELGNKLYNAVFNGEIRECFTRCRDFVDTNEEHGVRIRFSLENTPELINYPWEFLWNQDDDFLARSIYTPIVRYLPMGKPSRPSTIKSNNPLQMLVVMSNPIGSTPLSVDYEKRQLERALTNLIQKNLLHIEWLINATRQSLIHALDKYKPNILHYIGHGGVDENKGGYLVLAAEGGEKDFLKAQHLQVLLNDCKRLQLVTLNTCHGARTTTNADDPFASLAMSLTRAQVPVTVAMQHEISDKTAAEFAGIFYSCLSAGWSVYEAIGHARKVLYVEHNAEIEWMIPVLYSRSPDGVIFKREKIKQ